MRAVGNHTWLPSTLRYNYLSFLLTTRRTCHIDWHRMLRSLCWRIFLRLVSLFILELLARQCLPLHRWLHRENTFVIVVKAKKHFILHCSIQAWVTLDFLDAISDDTLAWDSQKVITTHQFKTRPFLRHKIWPLSKRLRIAWCYRLLACLVLRIDLIFFIKVLRCKS